jgi:hypothetical protein
MSMSRPWVLLENRRVTEISQWQQLSLFPLEWCHQNWNATINSCQLTVEDARQPDYVCIAGLSGVVGNCWGEGYSVKIFHNKNQCRTKVLWLQVHQKHHNFIVLAHKDCRCGLILLLKMMWKSWTLNAELIILTYSTSLLFPCWS